MSQYLRTFLQTFANVKRYYCTLNVKKTGKNNNQKLPTNTPAIRRQQSIYKALDLRSCQERLPVKMLFLMLTIDGLCTLLVLNMEFLLECLEDLYREFA